MASEDSVEDVLKRTLALLAVEVHRVGDLNDARKARWVAMLSKRKQIKDQRETLKSSARAEYRMYRPRKGTTFLDNAGREWMEYTRTDSLPGLG
jgi:hypothetical protein